MQPLEAKTVLVTRSVDQADELVLLLEQRGAKAILFPTIEITATEHWTECDQAIREISRFDGVVFTSVNAARYFLARLKNTNPSSLELLKLRTLYSVGEKISRYLKTEGISAVQYPGVKDSLSLARSMITEGVEGKRFLFPRGNISREELPTLLRKCGAEVLEVAVYETRKPPANYRWPEIKKMLSKGAIDVLTFFSPSAVENFLEMVPAANVDLCAIAVIGQTTAEAARKAFHRVDIIANQPTAAELVDSIVKFYE